MSKARLVITALLVDHQTRPTSPPSTACTAPGCTSSIARYEAEGEAAFEPRSRRPKTIPDATPPGDRRADPRLARN